MNRRVSLLGAATVMCGVAALPAWAGIIGSAHDFSAQSWSGGQICIVCHTPHGANLEATGAPLWNHALTTSVFQLYSSSTLDATLGQPDGASKLCLSCHDGTVALDSFGGRTGTSFIIPGEGAYVGTDLSNDHPISFVYDQALATEDGDLFDPTVATTALGGTIQEDLLSGGNRMQCTSCHDVHSELGHDELLWISNNNSALCLTCHDK